MDAAYIVFFRKVHTHEKCVLLPLLLNRRNSLLSKMEYLGGGWEVVRKLPNFCVFASASHSSFSGILWSSSPVSLYSVGPPTSCLVLSSDQNVSLFIIFHRQFGESGRERHWLPANLLF